jgi:hypothetical protein
MSATYVLIDFENVQPKALEQLKGANVHVHVFLGPKNTRLPRELVLALQSMGDRAQYVTLAASGANALDFVVAYELGVLTVRDREGSFYIVSKDKGFDPLVDLLRSRGLRVGRSASIEQLPNLVALAKRSATKGKSETPAKVIGSKSTAAADGKPSKPAGSTRRAATKTRYPEASANVEDLRQRALQSINARRSGKPARRKTLLNLLRANFGKDMPDARIQEVYKAMVAHGDVLVDGERLSYRASSS